MTFIQIMTYLLTQSVCWTLVGSSRGYHKVFDIDVTFRRVVTLEVDQASQSGVCHHLFFAAKTFLSKRTQ